MPARTAAAGPASSAARSPSPADARRRSNNWRTSPNAKPDSSSEPRARTSSWPSSSAREQAASTSEVLPMPAPPSISSTPPRCSSSSSTAARSRSRSRSLPTRPACRLRPTSVHSMPTRQNKDAELPNRPACPRVIVQDHHTASRKAGNLTRSRSGNPERLLCDRIRCRPEPDALRALTPGTTPDLSRADSAI